MRKRQGVFSLRVRSAVDIAFMEKVAIVMSQELHEKISLASMMKKEWNRILDEMKANYPKIVQEFYEPSPEDDLWGDGPATKGSK